MTKLLLLLTYIAFAFAYEPISPIPLQDNVNIKKAQLGKELFFDTTLSRDNSTACVSCHNVYEGGADSRVVSTGFDNRKGNIQSPTVFNARYNFRQFWNGRAKNLLEQADGPLTNPAEHNMDAKAIEDTLNDSKKYKELFENVYDVSHITYNLVLDAIVEFENALTTPNSKFDKFLRDEIKLDNDEHEGYKIFKQYGCITCHNGLNVGGNSFQKMGTFIRYESALVHPDRSHLTNKKSHVNVFKVPTLRNITLTAPYFHDGSAKNIKDAIKTMTKYNLGISIKDAEIEKIIKFLHTLEGERPKILDIK